MSPPGCNDEAFFDSNPSRDYSIGWSASQQTEFAQLTPQRLRHIFSPGRGAIEIARTILDLQIAPPLKRAARARLDQNRLRLEHQVAAPNPIPVRERAHIDDALPAHDLTADHPIKRSAVAQLGGAFGDHAGPVHVLAREAAFTALLELLLDPILEVADRITADTKLDEMKRHDGKLQDEGRADQAPSCGQRAICLGPARAHCGAGPSCNGVFAAGALFELEGWRAGDGAKAGLRPAEGSVPAAAAAVSRLAWTGAGSAVMMLTCGIDAADGK